MYNQLGIELVNLQKLIQNQYEKNKEKYFGHCSKSSKQTSCMDKKINRKITSSKYKHYNCVDEKKAFIVLLQNSSKPSSRWLYI